MAEYPGPLSNPPPNLSAYDLPLANIGGEWFRLHWCAYEPIYFGRSGKTRFDAPDGEYGILYLARDVHGAFIEVFGESRQASDMYPGVNVLETALLTKRCVCRISADRPLNLVDLSGPGLAVIGADERLCADEHAVARRWARALWAHPSQPDGLYYRARHDPSRHSVALYDRAADAIHASPQGTLLDNPVLLAQILHEYRFSLID